jgi:hypothetical protein
MSAQRFRWALPRRAFCHQDELEGCSIVSVVAAGPASQLGCLSGCYGRVRSTDSSVPAPFVPAAICSHLPAVCCQFGLILLARCAQIGLCRTCQTAFVMPSRWENSSILDGLLMFGRRTHGVAQIRPSPWTQEVAPNPPLSGR